MYFVWTVNSVPMATQTFFLSFLLTANKSGLVVMLDKLKVVTGTDYIEQDEVAQKNYKLPQNLDFSLLKELLLQILVVQLICLFSIFLLQGVSDTLHKTIAVSSIGKIAASHALS